MPQHLSPLCQLFLLCTVDLEEHSAIPHISDARDTLSFQLVMIGGGQVLENTTQRITEARKEDNFIF